MRIQAKITLLVGVLVITMGMAPAVDPPKEPVIFTNASGNWADCIGMPTGCQMLVLYGDVAKPGEFAVRFKYPARYRIGPHTHAGDEHATVISGGPFHIAVGDTFDEKASSGKTLHVGDLVVVPAGIHHFAWMEGETVLQVNGIGPFKRNFIDPADISSGVPR
jgi:quercetin dioxygenase-like cupin family protein